MSLILTNGAISDPAHWELFLDTLDGVVDLEGCDAETLRHSRRILTDWNTQLAGSITFDIPATLASFEDRGGYCDCEVLGNVADKPPLIAAA